MKLRCASSGKAQTGPCFEIVVGMIFWRSGRDSLSHVGAAEEADVRLELVVASEVVGASEVDMSV